jgi:hypothetical protein
VQHPYFNPECECLVVMILNTRRRIKGHYLVSMGTMDTITRTRLCAFLVRALNSFVWLDFHDDAYEYSSTLTVSFDSSASPSLRLPGLPHCREGFLPRTVVATRPRPVRRMPRWNTCGDTQGLVRTLVQPSSTECNFMSQLTPELSDAGGPTRLNSKRTWRARARSIDLVERLHSFRGMIFRLAMTP